VRRKAMLVFVVGAGMVLGGLATAVWFVFVKDDKVMAEIEAAENEGDYEK
jgi:hypothetical protein